jgi:tetratricopeptide (TPR) repeat protein
LADPAGADDFAASLRAGRFVTGDLLESSGRVRLTAYLHETGHEGDGYQRATVEGGSDDIFGMIDDLVARLLATTMGSGESERLQALATVTSGSLDATKEYLQGERHLRNGQYREAAAAYERAIGLDSTFALAHYRRSIAADWTDAYDIRSSAEHALRFADRLVPRDRRLLEALRLRRNGRIEESAQAFRALLYADPDDLEALVQYGELLFHDEGRRGGSTMESMVPFRRAVEIEPSNLIAHLHLARLYAIADSTERLEETARRMSELAPESERAVEVDALRAWALGDTALQRSVLGRLDGRAWYFRFYAAHGVGNYDRDAAGAREILTDREPGEPLLEMLALNGDVVEGRHAAVREYFRRPGIAADPNWNFFEAFLWTSGTLIPDERRMGELADRLAESDGEAIIRSAWLPPYEDQTPRLMEFERDYFRALLLAQLGRSNEARGLLARMREQEDFTGLGTVKADAERSIEAELRLRAGDRAGALEVLREMKSEVPHAATVRPLPDQVRARLLRGQLEMELGDPSTAEAFLLGLDESWSPWDAYPRPEIYVLLGRIAEDAGRTDRAISYYTRFIDLWADCDPELVPRREDIVARRNALVRSTG